MNNKDQMDQNVNYRQLKIVLKIKNEKINKKMIDQGIQKQNTPLTQTFISNDQQIIIKINK